MCVCVSVSKRVDYRPSMVFESRCPHLPASGCRCHCFAGASGGARGGLEMLGARRCQTFYHRAGHRSLGTSAAQNPTDRIRQFDSGFGQLNRRKGSRLDQVSVDVSRLSLPRCCTSLTGTCCQVGLDGGDGPRPNGSRELAGGCVGCGDPVEEVSIYGERKGGKWRAGYGWNDGCGCVRYNGKKAKPAGGNSNTGLIECIPIIRDVRASTPRDGD